LNQLSRLITSFIGNQSILSKLIASLLLIVTPLYVFNFIVTNIGAENNRKEIEQALRNSLQSYNNIMDSEFLRIQQMLRNSALDIAIAHVELDAANLTHMEKSMFFGEVGPYLSRIQYSSRFIKDTTALLPLLDTTQSTIAGLRKFDSGLFEALRLPSKPIISQDDQLFINAPFVTTSDRKDSMFILAVQISEPTVAAYLSKIMNFNRSGAVLFDSEGTWSVESGHDEPATTKIRQLLSAKQLEPHASSTAGPQIMTHKIQGEPYLIVYEPAANTNMMLAAFAPEDEIYGSLSIYKTFFYSLSILTILVIILFSFGLYRIIHKPLKTLMQAFRKVEIGQMRFTLKHRNDDEFGYLYRRFNNMTETLDNMVNVVYEQRLLSQRSELKRLQSQINPHFLYNSFFVLQRLIHSGKRDTAIQFAGYLGRYFQYITRDASDEIALMEDSLHAQAYVDIQSVCFDEHVSVSYESVPDAIKRFMVPRMIIQPLIENSFEHAFEKQLQQGLLRVSFAYDDEFVVVNIDDNGNQMADEQLEQMTARLEQGTHQMEESTGMINVHRRIRLKFGETSGLRLSRSELGGLRIQILMERKEVVPDAQAPHR
jgi:two-component system sensor histidine kinase YesM